MNANRGQPLVGAYVCCALLALLVGCSSLTSLEPSPELDESSRAGFRYNVLMNCPSRGMLQDILAAGDVNRNSPDEAEFGLVDYFEDASVAEVGLGASQVDDPWCLATIDVAKARSFDDALAQLSEVLHTAPEVLLRKVATEEVYGSDPGRHAFDVSCVEQPQLQEEASGAAPVAATDLRRLLGVTDASLTGEGVNIAVIDGGVANPQRFLRGEIARFSLNFTGLGVTQQDLEDTFDCPETPFKEGHGSLVTSIVQSVAPEANLMMLKACEETGYCRSSSLAKALLYLRNAYEGMPPVDIVNMSFGAHISEDDTIVRAIIESMTDLSGRTLIVASVGNDENEATHYPASFYDLHKGLVPVSALKRSERGDWALAGFNNQAILGATFENALAAPGVRLQLDIGDPEGVTGSSFAAPVVAGMAALERQKRPDDNATGTSLHLNLLWRAQHLGSFKLVYFNDKPWETNGDHPPQP